MSSNVVQIVDGNGNALHKEALWFPEDEELGSEVVTMVAILGAQASGKSTLLNQVLGTNFAVGTSATLGSATTKGITVAKSASSKYVVAIDVEGSDSRERGKADKFFHRKCASFVASVADVVLLNLWFHEVGRLDTTAYSLLDAVFCEAAKNEGTKSALVVVVRDVEDDVDLNALEQLLEQDVKEVWDKSAVSNTVPFSDFFELSICTLPHMRHRPAGFKESCEVLSKRLLDQDVEDLIAKPEFSKSLPFDDVAPFCQSLWESFFEQKRSGDATEDQGGNEKDSVMAAFHCNEIFSKVLSETRNALEELSAGMENGEKLEGFGAKADEILVKALDSYDKGTEKFRDDAIQSRKRHELESIIDTTENAIFMKQIQIVRENALVQFKASTSSDDVPSDFAFFTAVSSFMREAEESKRPDSNWNSKRELQDLQNMMHEISAQRKKLLTSQVSAAQQQAHAMQYLQLQQSQMNAIQAQAYGGGGPGQWNVGAAYRPPDTNINASLSYQQGRTNIQISMVPDDSASLLGPNGFTSGVGPGNLGLSFNIGL